MNMENQIHAETEALQEELRQFKQEKEQIRQLVGQIGGKHQQKQEVALNIAFILVLIAPFLISLIHKFFAIGFAVDPFVSLEIGVLLVSLKIIWMMHKQAKVEHFQFWILNSIEFRLNDISKRLREIDKRTK